MCDVSAEKEHIIQSKAYDAGYCNGLMQLGAWIRDHEKSTAQTKRIQELIIELTGSMNEN